MGRTGLKKTISRQQRYYGKLRIVQKLSSKSKFSLSIGSKNTRVADINLDIDPQCSPDIVADARFLPFRSSVFEQVFFTDVIEHLPSGSEASALQELHRVLKEGGELILSTPNDVTPYTFCDPAWYVMGHRHYHKEDIFHLLQSCGFEVEQMFTAGGYWQCISVLWYSFVVYPLRKILHLSLPYNPQLLERFVDKQYNTVTENGYTIFVEALKIAL